MPQILDADDINTHDAHEPEDAASIPGYGFAWETITRCLVVAAVVAMVAMLSWRPAMLRFSQLMFMVSPSHGDSLAWRAVDSDPSRPAPRKHTMAPAEWRLAATSFGIWNPSRDTPATPEKFPDNRLLDTEWQRLSFNPWSWQDDAEFMKKRFDTGLTAPALKTITAYRTREGEVWTEHAAATSQTMESSPAPLEIPALRPLEQSESAPAQEPDNSALAATESKPAQTPIIEINADTNSADEDKTSFQEAGHGMLELPPLAFDSFDDIDIPGLQAATENLPSETEKPLPANIAIPGIPGLDDAAPIAAIDIAPIDDLNDEVLHDIDWANTEITRPIPGAYLTIYPKLRFIGLCVPGQGYIRKYNQVAAPKDTEQPKLEAHDNRTPYGKYYIAARTRTANGPVLTLSWPSPDDARRAALPPGQLLDIENAWLAQTLPPQNTPAGGGVTINGNRSQTEETTGGFSLEEPHIEEISTALPDGAWVFIQP